MARRRKRVRMTIMKRGMRTMMTRMRMQIMKREMRTGE